MTLLELTADAGKLLICNITYLDRKYGFIVLRNEKQLMHVQILFLSIFNVQILFLSILTQKVLFIYILKISNFTRNNP